MLPAERACARLPAASSRVCAIFSQIGAIALNGVLDADIHLGERSRSSAWACPG